MQKSLALAALALLCLPSAAAEWRSFHNDERHTGFQAGTDYSVYEDVWWSKKLAPATHVEASPVIADGILVYADWAGVVRAYDAESGTEKWNHTMAAKMVGTPAISSSKLFVVDTAGNLKALDLQKGTVLGTAAVGITQSSPTIHEGKLFIGNEAGEMVAYDTETLTVLWKFQISSMFETIEFTSTGTPPNVVTTQTCKNPIPTGQIRGAPAVYQGKVIFGSLNHWVFALNEQGQPGQKTTPQWIFKTGDAVFGSPTIDHTRGRVLVGSYDEKVYSLPASPSGEGPILANGLPCTAFKNAPAWTYNVPADIGQSKVQSTPAVDGSTLYFGANNGRLYAVDAAAGTKRWEFTTGDAVISSPAVSNNVLVAGSDDGNVYWVDATTGAELKRFAIGVPVKASPALDGNRAFVAGYEGNLYMFGPKIPARPDLRVSALSHAGGVVSVTVQNAGDGDAVASTLRLLIDGALAADIAVPAVAAGQTATVTHAVGLSEGVHALKAQADQGAAVQEKDETNNERSEDVTVAPAANPTSGGGSGGKGGGKGLPAPGLGLAAAAVALALLLRRRR